MGESPEENGLETRSGGVNVNADHVDVAGDVVGRDKITQNIRQFIMRPWAWLLGLAILALGITLAAGIITVPALLPTPTPLPTPLAFAPAIEGQSLIMVADFEDRSSGRYQGIDPAQYIFEQMVAQAQKDGLDVRVERLRQVIDDNTARSIGEVYSATLVLWGWYDALTITPRMERIKTRTEYRSTEEGQHLSLADPAKVEFSIVTDLPGQATYLVLLTLSLDEYGDEKLDEALAYIDGALGAIPANVAGSTNPSEAYFFRGNILYVKGEYDQAIADYDEAIRLRPDDADAYYNRGNAYYIKGQYDRAIADYDETIRLSPDYAEAYNNRGITYDDKGEYDLAMADFDEAIRLSPDYAKAYNNRGGAYYDTGEHDRAIADFDEAIRLRPDDADAYYNRGIAYNDKGEYDRAIADYDEAIRLRPDDADAYYNRGIAYYKKDENDRAIADYDEAIRLSPDYAEAYNNRGIAYYDKGEYDLAMADFDEAIRRWPDSAFIYFTRGLAYEQTGETERATADYKKVLELSDDPDLRQFAEEHLKTLGAE